jgi:carboxyl-terminal processing protease
MGGRRFFEIFAEKRLRHFTVVLAAALIFSLGYGLGMQQRISAQDTFSVPQEVQEAFEPLWQIYNMIDTQYIDDVSVDVLVDGAAHGIVDALEDEYSGYMDPEEFPILNSDLEGEFVGIGVVITTNDNDEIEVVGIIEDAPAWGSGIQPGDIFHAVDGEEVFGWNQTEFAAKVRGVAGTDVTITVRRDSELFDFTITRALIVIPNVESELLDGNIAYVQLNNFSDDASDLLQQALEDLDVNSRAGLILDVRDNPGGFLHSAIDVTSTFIPNGVVVYETFGDGRETTFDATGEYFDLTVPMVLLINESSASASEILAGALQDTERATLIGETTLGKGTVQTWSPLINGGGIRLTIARWLTPSRRWIHENGVSPDLEIEWTPEAFEDETDPQLQAAVDYLLGEPIEAFVQTSNS